MLAAIQYAVNNSGPVGVNFVIDGIRKALGQQTVVAKDLKVNASKVRQGINVNEHRIEEIRTQSLALLFVKLSTFFKVSESRCEKPHSH
jgi:hypothetical protein